MAQKQLQAVVVIGGRVDNSFMRMGNALVQMSSMVEGVSQKLIDFGKDSIKVYSDYEYNMRTVEEIWGSNGTFIHGSREIKSAMSELSNAAAEWAANSIFHTDDVSNALVEAAHAGWGLNEMLNGIPTAMKLAQAGDMDLSTSLDYVLKSMKALQMEYGNLDTWVDEWVYASNRSAGTAEEFGDTMLRLGSTMNYAADPEEILALTAIMHNMGATGSEAGTMIRNSMMRLLAPSGVASKVLEQLGATDEEINAIREDSSKLAALQQLEAHGFSAFDDKGQAKPILEIYSSLGQALADLAGGYENISKNQTALGILSNVFGTRAQTGALNIVTALQEAQTLYDELSGGAANDAAGKMAEGMMDTLYGKMETFKSKVEELKRSVGEELAPGVETWLGRLGNFVDSVTNLDDTKFSALVGGLTGLAGAAVGMKGVGMALQFIGQMLSPGGMIAMGTVTALALAEAVAKIQETEYMGQFGEMNLDMSTLGDYVKTLGSDFDTAWEGVNKFAGALETAVTNYKTAAETFQSNLITDVLTDKTWTADDLKSYESLGADIIAAALTGVKTSTDLSMEFWRVLMEGGNTGDIKADAAYLSVMDALTGGLSETQGQLEAIGQGLTGALTKAFADGLTPENVAAIQSYFEELNQIIAEAEAQAKDDQEAAALQVMLHKAQSMSYEDAMKYVDEMILPARDERLSHLEDTYLNELYKQNIIRDRKIEKAESEEEKERLIAEKESFNQASEEAYSRKRAGFQMDYDKGLLTLYRELMRSSGLEEMDTTISTLTQGVQSGLLTPDVARGILKGNDQWIKQGLGGQFQSSQAFKWYSDMAERLGGTAEIQSRIAEYQAAGNVSAANQLQTLLNNWSFLVSYSNETGASTQYDVDNKNAITGGEYTPSQARSSLALLDSMGITGVQGYFEAIGKDQGERVIDSFWAQMDKSQRAQAAQMVEALSQTYDFDRLLAGDTARQAGEEYANRNEYAAWRLMNMSDEEAYQYRQYTPEIKAAQAELAGMKDSLSSLNTQITDIETPHRYGGNLWVTEDQTPLTEPGGLYEQRDATQAAIAEQEARIAAMIADFDSQKMPTPEVQATPAQTQMSFEPISIFDIITGSFNLSDWFGGQKISTEIDPIVDAGQVSEQIGTVPVKIEPMTEGANAVDSLQDQGVQVKVEGDTAELQATIDAADGQNLMSYVSGDTTNLQAAIYAQDGRLLSENVYGNTSALASAISQYDGKVITVTIKTNRVSVGAGFAKGGRADEESVFGEDGPEWAIPEEHTDNTAKLLADAAKASGFTLEELAEMDMYAVGGRAVSPSIFAEAGPEWAIPEEHTPNTANLLVGAARASGFGLQLAEMPNSAGGGSGDSGNESDGGSSSANMQVYYAPTINADNAEGVDKALKEDKERFQKWWEDRLIYESVVRY